MINDLPALESKIRQSTDFRSFVSNLLVDALQWPLTDEVESVEDIAFDWTEKDLRAQGLDKHLVDAAVRHIRPFTSNQPWGVFILEFRDARAVQTGRGLTSVLRKVLRGLVPSRRRDSQLPAWKREHLLFIATYDYTHFSFAYFQAPGENTKTAPLRTFGWGPGDPLRTVCEFNLRHLEWPDDPADGSAWIDAWTRAFDVEKVTKRFFEDYRARFAEVEAAIQGIDGAERRRLYTQRLFNRLLFIYFIQRKGWLRFQGRADYLRALFADAEAKGEDFLSDRLHWLFFCGFNQLKSDRSPEDLALLAEKCGEIPYLNGGLFALADKEDERGVVSIPNAVFKRLFETLGRYNFTVSESTPWDIEVAVDPEMLGKVFEELVTGRHESGSYYTPRPVVSFMCKEALKGFLERGAAPKDGDERQPLAPEAIEALVDEYDASAISVPDAKRLIAVLEKVRVVDPACGSGAYLLGMLHELQEITRALDTRADAATARDDYQRKLVIIENALYGVDIDPFAANIARLRLWLSLAVEYQGPEPEPLPNLDFKIEVGNSVLAPNPDIEGQDDFGDEVVKQFRQAKVVHMRARSQEKAEREKEVQALRDAIAHWYAGRGTDFDWVIDFADVFAEGGFDIVLANPPYVRKELIEQSHKGILRKNFSPAITGQSDLYCAFYVRALQLCKPGGMHVFVCSNSWLDVGYGVALQKFLLEKSHIACIVDSVFE